MKNTIIGRSVLFPCLVTKVCSVLVARQPQPTHAILVLQARQEKHQRKLYRNKLFTCQIEQSVLYNTIHKRPVRF
jgi:hypothetical protein